MSFSQRAAVALSAICHSLAGHLNYGTGFGHVIGGGLAPPGDAVYSAPPATIAAASATPVAVSQPAPAGLRGPATLTVTVGAKDSVAGAAVSSPAVKLPPLPVAVAQPAAGAPAARFPLVPSPPRPPPPPALVGAAPPTTVTVGRPAPQVLAAPPQAAVAVSRPIPPPPQHVVPAPPTGAVFAAPPLRPGAVVYQPPLPRPTYTYQAPLPVTFTRQVYHNPYAAALPPHLSAYRPHPAAFPRQVLAYQGGLPYPPQTAFTATTYHHPPPGTVASGPPSALVTTYRGPPPPVPVTRHVFMMYPAPVSAAYSPHGQVFTTYPGVVQAPVGLGRPLVSAAPVAVGYSGGVAYGMANNALKQNVGAGTAIGGHNNGLGGRHYLVNKKKS